MPDTNLIILHGGHSYLSDKQHLEQLQTIVAPDFEEGEFVFNSKDIDKLYIGADNLYLWQSQDDPALECTHGYKYRDLILPSDQHIFQDRGHFISSSFLELSRIIIKSWD